MARTFEDAKRYATLIQDKNKLKAQIAGFSDTLQIGKRNTDVVSVTDYNLVIKKRDLSASNSFILGHPINGKLGVANGMGGGQIVLGDDGNVVITELSRYRWTWDSEGELDDGSYDENIDISNGDIRLA